MPPMLLSGVLIKYVLRTSLASSIPSLNRINRINFIYFRSFPNNKTLLRRAGIYVKDSSKNSLFAIFRDCDEL